MTRISATRTCSRAAEVPGGNRTARGFTLLEILLVVTIVGILASVVVLGATDVGRQRGIRAEAERLALALELARDEARLRNEVWGLGVSGGSYQFRVYDETENRWREAERPEFAQDATDDGIEFVFVAVATGSREHPLDKPVHAAGGRHGPGRSVAGTDAPDDVPDVVVYPGGELTPFKIVVSGGDAFANWVARSDGVQRVEALLESEDIHDDDDVEEWLLDAGLVQ